MSRSLWFVAGAGAGVYAANRARRALDSLTADGLRHRWHGLTHAARVAGEELHAARAERETELRERMGLPAPAPAHPQLTPAAPAAVDPPRDDTRDRT